ncbi:MAG TPA: carbohydrate kinase family protein [Gemmatimonadaceae bacterium]
MKKRRVGVLGTFVWDVIYGRDVRTAPVQEWGGITYALAGFDAALPDDWEIVPIMKVGDDLSREARTFLSTLRRLAADAAPVLVPYPNNRVELRYVDAERRSEVLTGGVPGWTWQGLQPLVADLDALYVNLISGFELDLETFTLLRQHFGGPIYCDLHSLVLAVQPTGLRTLQPLPRVGDWCRCFDVLQVNEDELSMMAPDGLALAATALAAGVQSLVVTLGPRGSVYFAPSHFARLADRRAERRPLGSAPGALRTERLAPAAHQVHTEGDPTGCGDVFGATFYSRLLAGDIITDALRAAIGAAARNVEHRGATGLAHFLRGELSPS